MTIEGAIVDLQNWIDSEEIPFWAKPSLQKILETVEAEREEHLWIPVTERLPEEEGYYLVTVFDDWRHISEICIEYWWGKRQDWSTALEVIAWMPSLPKPYEGSETE